MVCQPLSPLLQTSCARLCTMRTAGPSLASPLCAPLHALPRHLGPALMSPAPQLAAQLHSHQATSCAPQQVAGALQVGSHAWPWPGASSLSAPVTKSLLAPTATEPNPHPPASGHGAYPIPCSGACTGMILRVAMPLKPGASAGQGRQRVHAGERATGGGATLTTSARAHGIQAYGVTSAQAPHASKHQDVQAIAKARGCSSRCTDAF